jgi:hypothetical protein
MILKIRTKHVLLILLLLLVGVALYFYKNQKAALKLVLPEPKEITLLKAFIRNDTAYMELFTVAENNSPYKLNIDSIYCDFYLAGKKLISEDIKVGLVQEKGQIDTVSIKVRIPIDVTRKTIAGLQDKDSTGLTFDAKVVYNTIFGKRSLSVSKDKRIEVPVPPVFKILATRSHDLKLFKKEVKTDLYLQITNEGKNLDLEIEDMQYKLRIDDQLTTKGKFGRQVNIRPGTVQTLHFPLDFDMQKPLTTIFEVITDTDRVPFYVQVSGYLNFGNMKRVPTVIEATGYLEIRNEDKQRELKAKDKKKRKAEKQKKKEK